MGWTSLFWPREEKPDPERQPIDTQGNERLERLLEQCRRDYERPISKGPAAGIWLRRQGDGYAYERSNVAWRFHRHGFLAGMHAYRHLIETEYRG